MNSSLRRGLFLVTVIGAMTVPGERAMAAQPAEGAASGPGNLRALQEIAAASGEQGEYSDMAFTNVGEDTFLFVRSGPSRECEWVGKLYPGSVSRVIGPVEDWTRIQSGTVTGYVYTAYIITGDEAEQKAEVLAAESGNRQAEETFFYAESRQEEQARLEAEAAKQEKAEAEAAAAAQETAAQAADTGQEIADYACRFIGNPYVWGGTSLTEGADCSGFVQTVYAQFGISLPRTTWDQEYAGTEITYSDARPGDLILYEGHVGIYIGNGQIVNAINPSKGIGILPAECMSIKTVRRVISVSE